MKSSPVTAAFGGFTPAAFTFFRGLAKNNNRDWFQKHKEEFESACREPLKALTVALDPPSGAERISRIYRDVRFSKDKSPYHTHLSTMTCGYYLQLSADGLYVGTGLYMPEPEILRKMRTAIEMNTTGTELADIVSSLRKKGYTVGTHESVASAPRGFSADHPRIELLRMKDIHAGKMHEPKTLSTAKAINLVLQTFTAVAPLQQWLHENVGETNCQ